MGHEPTVSVATVPPSAGVIDLTQDEDAGMGSSVIDLTGHDDGAETIDPTL